MNSTQARFLCAIAAGVLFPVTARAQQTVFNVPSPDVLDPGRVYLETDHYFQNWKSDVDDVGFALVRGVYGLVPDVEIGVNSGPFDYHHPSVAFADAAVKWKPWQTDYGRGEEKGSCGFYVGNNLGVNVHGDPEHDSRDYAYTSGFVTLPDSKTRLSAGPYYATADYFAAEERFGAQMSLEQPMQAVAGLTAAADWISGDGGALTTGVILAKSPWTFYLGYGFANTGRDADLLTLEFGVTF